MSFFQDLYDKARDKFRLRKLKEVYPSDVSVIDQYQDGYNKGYKDGYQAAFRDKGKVKDSKETQSEDGIPPPP